MKVREFSNAQLYTARLKANLTQADLAYALRKSTNAKTTERNIRRWEAGTNTPHGGLIPALADALGVTVDELYSDADAEEEDSPMDKIRRIRAELVLAGRDDLAADLLMVAQAVRA